MSLSRFFQASAVLGTLVTIGSAGAALTGCGLLCTSSVSDEAAAPSSGGRDFQNAGAAAPNEPSTRTDATRLVAEADIVQLDAERNWLYTISRSGTLAVVDGSQPSALTLLGKFALRGEPFEMYRREGALLVLANQGVRFDGGLADPLPEDATPTPPVATSSSLLQAIDLADPASPKAVGTLSIPGEIADSRIVGDVLYVASWENGACYGCGPKARTVVTTFDVASPSSPKQIDQIVFESAATYANVTTTTTPWKRSIIATKDRLYVGGIGAEATSTNEGVIEVLDISDPTGHLVHGATLAVAGPILSRWQMDEYDGVLRVVSQRGATRNPNGEQYPDVDTFRIESSASLVRVGHTTLQLPRQEGLKSVRFDGKRAYAITFETVTRRDPLFTIDLSDPAKPTQKGDLDMPGWVFHIVPRGDRLIGLGLDREQTTASGGALNVSLFDVADLSRPALLSRVAFGPQWASSDAELTQLSMAEDQDRIQKAFRLFDDGLITIPFSDPATASSCRGGQSGVQLVEWTREGLTKRAMLPVDGNPRRALRRDSSSTREVIAVSDSHVVAFDIRSRDAVVPTAKVEIGRCVPRPVSPQSSMPGGGGGGPWMGGEGSGWEGGEGIGGSSSCR